MKNQLVTSDEKKNAPGLKIKQYSLNTNMSQK